MANSTKSLEQKMPAITEERNVESQFSVNDIAELTDKDIIVISHSINRGLHKSLSEVISSSKLHKNCIVYLTTFGGDADAAYRIGRCLQHHYENIRVVIPGFCKSAGTLICMAANELGIGDLGELGPLDVQILRKDEVGDRSSGLDITEAMGIISNQITSAFQNNLLNLRKKTRLSTKIAGDFAVRLATSIIEPLYTQIDPQTLGENQRAIAIAYQYGIRLSNKNKSITEPNLLRLITQYPSHGFVIDRGEAKEIFAKVNNMTKMENTLADLFGEKPMSEPKENAPVLFDGNEIAKKLKKGLDNETKEHAAINEGDHVPVSAEESNSAIEASKDGASKENRTSRGVRKKD